MMFVNNPSQEINEHMQLKADLAKLKSDSLFFILFDNSLVGLSMNN